MYCDFSINYYVNWTRPVFRLNLIKKMIKNKKNTLLVIPKTVNVIVLISVNDRFRFKRSSMSSSYSFPSKILKLFVFVLILKISLKIWPGRIEIMMVRFFKMNELRLFETKKYLNIKTIK